MNKYKMTKLRSLARRIHSKTLDPISGFSETPLLGYQDNRIASINLTRYVFVSKYVNGTVLDLASGSCYGSSILRRKDDVKLVVSVDINIDVLRWGRLVFDAECVCADASHLPFRRQVFDYVVSLETLEHIRDQKMFLNQIKTCLKKDGKLILSTPNKIYSSPFLKNPLNPYHTDEFYIGPLLNFLRVHGFKVDRVYGGRKVEKLELLRRIFGTLIKFCLRKLSLKPYLLDYLYHSVYKLLSKHQEYQNLIDPNPNMFKYEIVKTTSNLILYQHFLIFAHPLNMLDM